ncbi:MAG: cytochrome c oxidase assembly protein [Gammaproteobacteria bacterium]
MHHPIRKSVLIPALIAVFMFGFSFALSPLYNVFCKATGFNSAVKIPLESPDLNREISVQFVTTNNANLPWQFYPFTTSLRVHPGENARVVFFAKNNTKKIMTVQAIPSFTPPQSAKHFHKIQCFCFNQQTLNPGESMEMPVVFHIDKLLPQGINTITLAYTLFEIAPKFSQRIAL